jgi:hypothetical protein
MKKLMSIQAVYALKYGLYLRADNLYKKNARGDMTLDSEIK